MDRKIFLLACVTGGLGVIFGAFAAHGLKPLISSAAFQSLNTGIRYQMYHALLLFLIGIIAQIKPAQKSILYKLISIGVLLFSGSIYFLSTNTLTSFNFNIIGFLTPIGGLFLISSWVLLFIFFFRIKK